MHDLKDEEIISLIREKGDNDLFSILYERYYLKVLDRCFGLLKNRGQAEEFTEDIFSKVFEKIIGKGAILHFSSWLYSVTYNYCIDYMRARKNLHYPSWNRENDLPEIQDESEEEIAEISYDRFLLVLELIHPEEKALVLMKYQDNISLREIGKSLRISEDAAKMRLKRARTRIIYLYKSLPDGKTPSTYKKDEDE